MTQVQKSYTAKTKLLQEGEASMFHPVPPFQKLLIFFLSQNASENILAKGDPSPNSSLSFFLTLIILFLH